ncbi:MAG: bacteriohemerythrin [Gammaproteobacteria bacterium]|nr:bacteriohemerythrin [Gammaproteobacteria bacterium]
MESFHWDKHFVTRLEAIDRQHRSLVDIINEFGELIADNRVNHSDINEMFRKLTNYAVLHFRTEEALMEHMGIDPRHKDAHIKSHRRFLEDTVSMYARISENDTKAAQELLEFLTHWLAYHILGQDQHMARQIHAIRAGVDPASAYTSGESGEESSTAPLVDALTGLFALVSARNDELHRLNQSLEDKVADRTRALSEANNSLEKMSLTDVLTGLPNRRHAIQFLTSVWQESTVNDTPMTCIMVDADHFKEVNDRFGHDVGDRVLKELAATLKHTMRNDDCVCRLGGDEFFIICPNTDKQGGMRVGEMIQKAVSRLQVKTSDEYWHGSVSVGVAHRRAEMASHEQLIKAADEGVYAAKEAGKNCVRAV